MADYSNSISRLVDSVSCLSDSVSHLSDSVSRLSNSLSRPLDKSISSQSSTSTPFSWHPGLLCLELFEMITKNLFVQDKTKFLVLDKEWNAFMEANAYAWKDLDFGPLEIPRSEFKLKPGSDLSFYITPVWSRWSARDGYEYRNIISEDRYYKVRTRFESFNITPLLRLCNNRARSGIRRIRVCREHQCADWSSLITNNWRFLVDLELAGIQGETGSLEYLAQRVPSLKKLDIGGSFSISIAMLFLENCLELEYADFEVGKKKPQELSCTGRISSKLRTLLFHIHDTWLLSDSWEGDFPDGLINNALALEEIFVVGDHLCITPDYRHLTGLRRLYMSCGIGPSSLDLLIPPTVEELSLTVDSFDETSIITPLPSLKYLDLVYQDRSLGPAGLKKLCKAITSPNFATLRISFLEGVFANYPASTGGGVVPFMHCLRNSGKVSTIRKFTIITLPGLDDEFVQSVGGPEFSKLEEITIAPDCPLVTPDAVVACVDKLPALKLIRLCLCDGSVHKELETRLAHQDVQFVVFCQADVWY